MTKTGFALPPLIKSLSARLLVLTVFFVMLSEVLIYVPSVARFRLVYLQEKLAAGQLASLSLEATPDNMVSEELRKELLGQVGARGVVLIQDAAHALMLSDDMPAEIDASYDLRSASPMPLIRDAFETLLSEPRIIRVVGPARGNGGTTVEVILDEAPMQAAMLDYSSRIMALSIVISLITATLVYLSLQFLMVRPMRRITESMMAFHAAPEDTSKDIAPSGRSDEIGMAQRELAQMQADLRASLRQKTHLAALGTAVSKINHDLRNVLATAQLVSDRLAHSEDPEVQRLTPPLVASLDRAIDMCMQTLAFGRADEPEPKRRVFTLHVLLDDVGASLGLMGENAIVWRNETPEDLQVNADREQMFRVFLNLGRNSVEVLEGSGEIRVTAEREDSTVTIEFADTGPGLSARARQHLFEPFAASSRSGGTGLGLAISRELMRAHGGDITLGKSDQGALFRLQLPDN
jgi:signal transduction histidine kinase